MKFYSSNKLYPLHGHSYLFLAHTALLWTSLGPDTFWPDNGLPYMISHRITGYCSRVENSKLTKVYITIQLGLVRMFVETSIVCPSLRLTSFIMYELLLTYYYQELKKLCFFPFVIKHKRLDQRISSPTGYPAEPYFEYLF